MSLNIIYGAKGYGKTNFCEKIVEKNIKNNKNILFITPEQISLTTERNFSKRYSGKDVSKIHVLSLERLINYVFSVAGPVLNIKAADNTKRMFIEKILIKNSNKLTIFQKAATRNGFASVILELIKEFKRHNITPENLFDFSEKISDTLTKFKLKDICLIYSEYEKCFDEISDGEDNMKIIADKISTNKLFNGWCVIFDGFTGFNPNQLLVILELLKNADTFTISLETDTLNTESKNSIFYRSIVTANTLFKMAIDNNIEILPNIFLPDCHKYFEKPEFLHLEKNLYKYPAKVYDDEIDNIEIFNAKNYYTECLNAVRWINNNCRENDYRYRDFAIVTGNDMVYNSLLKSAFQQFEIPFYIDQAISAINHPLTEIVLNIFDILTYNYSNEYMLKWLKSGVFYAFGDDIYKFENFVLEHGVSKKMWKSGEDFYAKGNFGKDEIRKINEIKNTVFMPINEFANNFSGRKTVGEIILALKYLIEKIDLKGFAKHMKDELYSKGYKKLGDDYIVVYNYFCDTCSMMYYTMNDLSITFEKFSMILKSGLSDMELKAIPPVTDCVTVCDAQRFNDEKKCILILGLNDGVLPKGYINEGIFSDEERNVINECGNVALDLTENKHKDEEHLIYKLLLSANEKLYISFADATEEDEKLSCSPVVLKLEKIFPKIRIDDDFNSNNQKLINGVIPTFNELIAGNLKNYQGDLEKWYKDNKPELFDIITSAKKYDNNPHKLRNDIIEDLYGKSPKYSISKIEQYNKCAYAYFLKYGLKAKPRKKYMPEAVDYGNLLHKIVEEFCDFGNEYGWEKIDEQIINEKTSEFTKNALVEIINTTFLKLPQAKYTIKKILRIMLGVTKNITEFYQQSGYVSYGNEVEFDDEKAFDPIEIKFDNGQIAYLTGKVDRVDILKTNNKNYINIVDYKSSAKTIDFTKIFYGVQIQLPIYIKAICDAIKNETKITTIPAAMLYYKFDSPTINGQDGIDDESLNNEIRKSLKMQGVILKNEEVIDAVGETYAVKSNVDALQIEQMCEIAYNRLEKAIGEILSGKISINPAIFSKGSSCDYCDYKKACAFDPSNCNRLSYFDRISRKEFFEHAMDKRSKNSNRNN